MLQRWHTNLFAGDKGANFPFLRPAGDRRRRPRWKEAEAEAEAAMHSWEGSEDEAHKENGPNLAKAQPIERRKLPPLSYAPSFPSTGHGVQLFLPPPPCRRRRSSPPPIAGRTRPGLVRLQGGLRSGRRRRLGRSDFRSPPELLRPRPRPRPQATLPSRPSSHPPLSRPHHRRPHWCCFVVLILWLNISINCEFRCFHCEFLLCLCNLLMFYYFVYKLNSC